MNAMVPAANFSAQQLALIRKTIAKDSTPQEFDQFVEFCRMTRLNPLRRQVTLFVFNKNKPDKRQVVFVTTIDGLRAIADRSGNYRPDTEPPRITCDAKLKGPLNPMGIVKVHVNVFKWSHGEWFPVAGETYWDEFAPIRDVWKEDPETGKRVKTDKKELDPTKEGWVRMPHLMIAKTAEAQALRKGWPEDLSGIYGEEEVDRMKTIELTATEIADEADKAERYEKIGGANAILIDWMDGEALQRVPAGKFFDAAMAFIKAHMKEGEEEAGHVLAWKERNRASLTEFWAMEKDAALALKKELEKVEAFHKRPAKGG